MRTKKVTRHYCDHCAKGGFNGPQMLRHEMICFKNPDRSCPLCCQTDVEMTPMKDLRKAVVDDGLEALIKQAHGCPACISAAILQTREEREYDHLEFDYKEALKKFDDEHNKTRFTPEEMGLSNWP